MSEDLNSEVTEMLKDLMKDKYPTLVETYSRMKDRLAELGNANPFVGQTTSAASNPFSSTADVKITIKVGYVFLMYHEVS